MGHYSAQCVLCRRDSELLDGTSAAMDHKIRCQVCGDYRMSGTLRAILQDRRHDPLRPYLSAHTRQTNLDGVTTAFLTEQNFQELAQSRMNVPVSVKARRLLEVLRDRTKYPGDQAAFDANVDYPLISGCLNPGGVFLSPACFSDEGHCRRHQRRGFRHHRRGLESTHAVGRRWSAWQLFRCDVFRERARRCLRTRFRAGNS